MNDDNVADLVESLRSEHRQLDEEITRLIEGGAGDQIEIARLKKRKLLIKDRIQLLLDQSVPDIIA